MSLWLLACNRQSLTPSRVEKGNFKQTLVESGELAAVRTKSFVMERYGRRWYEFKIIGLLDHGTKVKAGDSLIQLDPTEIKNYIVEQQSDLEIQKAALEKMLVDRANRQSAMKASLKNEEASFRLKKLGMEYSKFESERIRNIRELEFKQAEIAYNKVVNNMKMSEIIADNDLKIQQIRVQRLQNDIQDAYAILPRLTIRTPIPGIFQVGTNRRGNTMLKLGDMVYQGTSLGNVPDLTWMQVNATVDETDYLKIFTGQKVTVRLDALPKVAFPGQVVEIAKLCHPKDGKSKQKVFDIVVRMLVSDERLKPGMTVSCEFICEDIPNVLFIPLNCVERTPEGTFAYVKKGTTYERTAIQTGPANNRYIVVKDLKEGQLVAPLALIEQKK
jgi:multidrug efflux pump subunit AcrA (membrane-fusion protein)